jgi:ankyrin repeat protein
LISAPELSKHLTTSQCPCIDAVNNALLEALLSGHCDVVKCLPSSGADINLRDENGRSSLFTASMNGHCDVVLCLLSSGADINLCDEVGVSPLFIASCKGECDVVKCLLQ